MAQTNTNSVKNKDPAPIQITAEHMIGEAASMNVRGGGDIRAPDASDVAASNAASGAEAAVGGQSRGRHSNKNDEPSPKRQRTDEESSDGPSSASEKVASKCRTATLFVGNLHHRIGDAHLQKLFSPYGTLQRVSLVKHGAGPTDRGYAFVEFASVESARMAIRRVDGRILLGKALAVRPAHEKTGAAATGDGDGESGGSAAARTAAATADPRLARKEKSEVESKIEAVKRAIEEKRARAAAGKSFDWNR